jgi:hypothetical protein
MEWLKVKVLTSNPNTAKTKMKTNKKVRRLYPKRVCNSWSYWGLLCEEAPGRTRILVLGCTLD